MARSNGKPSRRISKKHNKKQMYKKQAALVQRCIQALNSNADSFRAKITNPKPQINKPSNGSLKHFKPALIETIDRSTISDTIDTLGSKFSIADSDHVERKT